MIKITGGGRRAGPESCIVARSAGSLSVVIPMRNEQWNIGPLLARLLPVLDRLGIPAEILCVDDGSQDGTLATLKERRAGEQRLKIIRLSRNFGKEVALAAGLEHASGDVVVLMDADLQHPPELIETFIERWRAGYEMVYGVRRLWVGRSRRRTLASRLFYRLFSILANSDLPRGAGDFRLLDRRVVDALNACTERSRFNNGLYAWLGFRHVGVPFEVSERANGRSRWSVFALWRFAIDAITSFSTMPLRIWSYLGVLVSAFALSYGAFIVLHTLIVGKDVPGLRLAFRRDHLLFRRAADQPGGDRRISRPRLRRGEAPAAVRRRRGGRICIRAPASAATPRRRDHAGGRSPDCSRSGTGDSTIAAQEHRR